MKFISTREKKQEVNASEAILTGIASQGGLFVPSSIPKINIPLETLKEYNYEELALYILSLFLEDFSKEELKEAINAAYKNNFSAKEIVPLKEVGDCFFMELYHGPTLAFKDIALTLLPRLLNLSAKKQGSKLTPVVLTATSGDTGKAALEGFSNAPGVKIMVFYPENGVSKIQKLQMNSQEGDNCSVIGIKGNFDNAQRGVKELFQDKALKEKLAAKGYTLTSANSINIGRLLPQIVYYFYSYLTLLREGKICLGEEINFSVPTGNFGDILAGYYGKLMGLPVNKLLCASNENNVLYDFFQNGVYDRRRELKITTSPSMDILISSNLERLLFEASGRDEILIKNLMEELTTKGFYEISSNIKERLQDFYGDFTKEEEVLPLIKELYDRTNYLMDTHTAVAYGVYRKYQSSHKDGRKTVILSTASPFKFASSICKALSLKIEEESPFNATDVLSDSLRLPVPEAIEMLKRKPILHNTICLPKDMKKSLESFLGI